EPFHPDRIASRILGMGDVLTLIDKAQAAVSEEELQKIEEKLRQNRFTLDDFLVQFESLKKMGNIADIMGMIPGAGKLKINPSDFDEYRITQYQAIIRSMTKVERERPEIIKASRRKRIANGSGTSIQTINQLLNQFEQIKTMMKTYGGGKKGLKGGRFPF
ncbi:MAG: signal recognition particle protein, partial [Firmicutes bacterium]|nr:signal recognition particle protein [Bacillota bacterium]